MSQAKTSYKALSQCETRNETENGNVSLGETSDELTSSSSSKDSLDLVLLEIGSKRKVRRKRRRKMGIHNFDATESYEVNEPLPIFNVTKLLQKLVSTLTLSAT